jgi:hypothetical protein
MMMTRGVSLVLCTLVLGACRREDASPPAAPRAAPAAADAPKVAGPPARAEPAEPAPARSREAWIDGNIYRFRLDEVRTCPAPAGSAARIGAVVRVASKIDQLLVAPRDFKLESDGVILDSAIATAPPPGCAPLLAPKSVRAGKTADGVVVFDLPPGFNADHRPVKITYQPTRWGGARRVEAVLAL